MILEGRSPRHGCVYRAHRVDLDWLFERIRLDSSVSARDVRATDQVADISTKRCVRNHLVEVSGAMVSHSSTTKSKCQPQFFPNLLVLQYLQSPSAPCRMPTTPSAISELDPGTNSSKIPHTELPDRALHSKSTALHASPRLQHRQFSRSKYAKIRSGEKTNVTMTALTETTWKRFGTTTLHSSSGCRKRTPSRQRWNSTSRTFSLSWTPSSAVGSVPTVEGNLMHKDQEHNALKGQEFWKVVSPMDSVLFKSAPRSGARVLWLRTLS